MTEQQQDETSIMERWYQINASKSITPMVAETLDLPPSCVEFVPWDRNTDKPVDDHWFVVGTYNLERDPEDEGHDIQDSVNVQNEEGGSQGGAVDVENEAEESNVPPKKLQSRNGSLNLFRITGNKL
jgi:diphthamide biosynthesis protein 7